MLNTPHLIILALVCHTNIIASVSLTGLTAPKVAIKPITPTHPLAFTGGLKYTKDLASGDYKVADPTDFNSVFRMTEDGKVYHQDFPGDRDLPLVRTTPEQLGRAADNEDQPKAVIIGVRTNPEDQNPEILLTQRLRNQNGPVNKIKNPEFPRGHLLKDEFERLITFERLAELRKGPLADVQIGPGSQSGDILAEIMKKAAISEDDELMIPKLAAYRELYEETGQWGPVRDIRGQKIYAETKPEQSSKFQAGGDQSYNQKKIMPFIIDIPPGQRPVYTLESYGRELAYYPPGQVANTIGRKEMQAIWQDLRSQVKQIAMKNAATHQYNPVPPPLNAISAN